MKDCPIDLEWLQASFSDLRDIIHLGSGGQKHVFGAAHSVDGKVVLKLLRPDTDAAIVQREIRAQATIRSRRVPSIYANGTIASPIGDLLWLREQRISGSDLRQYLKHGALTPALCVRVGQHLAEALLAAEACQIVHRDVKPENILVDERSNFWLIDFGFARHLDLVSLTPSDHLFGKATPGYAPLEQFYNKKHLIDIRTDVFSYGVTLYECLLGENPYRTNCNSVEEVIEKMEAIVSLEPQANHIPAGIADLIAACTQREHHHRPSSFQIILDQIKQIS